MGCRWGRRRVVEEVRTDRGRAAACDAACAAGGCLGLRLMGMGGLRGIA